MRRLRLGVVRGDAAETGVGEDIAVDVAQDHVLAELARVAELDDAPVLWATTSAFGAPIRSTSCSGGAALTDLGEVAAAAAGRNRARACPPDAAASLAVRACFADGLPEDPRRRARGGARGRRDGRQRAPRDPLAGDRQAAVGQAGERRDHVPLVARDELGAQQHRVDVFLGVVVGEDRRVQVRGGSGCAQVAGGGEDRVDGVVGVGIARVEGVHAVLNPRCRHELHPADRSGRGHRLVGAVVGLDLVDRREDLPRHAVLDGRGLVDRQQEQRYAIEGERLRGGRRTGQFRRERFGLRGDDLRSGGDVVVVGSQSLAGRGGRRLRRRHAAESWCVLEAVVFARCWSTVGGPSRAGLAGAGISVSPDVVPAGVVAVGAGVVVGVPDGVGVLAVGVDVVKSFRSSSAGAGGSFDRRGLPLSGAFLLRARRPFAARAAGDRAKAGRGETASGER